MLWSKPAGPNIERVPSPTFLWSKPDTTAVAAAPSIKSGPPSPRIKNPGRRIAQIVRLRPEFRDEYRQVHASVWPEVLKQIKSCNIEDYSIFHDDDTGILFATFKYVGYDLAGDMDRMRDNEKVRQWWSMTDGWQESMVPGATSSADGSRAGGSRLSRFSTWHEASFGLSLVKCVGCPSVLGPV